MTGTDGARQELRLERLIPASPERLFALWTEATQIARWWAPDGYEAVVHDLDVRAGGRWRIVLLQAGGKMAAMGGFFHVVEPPRRLAFSWAWEEADGRHGARTEVTVSFEPVPGGTRLILLQQGFDSKDARDRHLGGWSASVDRLMGLGREERQ